MKNLEQLNEKCFSLFGDEYKILEIISYKNYRVKVNVQHILCGHIWSVATKDFLKIGSKCPKCRKRNNGKRTTESFKNEVQEMSNGEYELLSEYIKWTEKVKILHKTCQKTFLMTPKDFCRNHRCPDCMRLSSIKNKTQDHC